MRRKGERGATLFEALFACAVMSIALATGMPSLRAMRAPYMLASATRLMSADVAAARLRAIARNERQRLRIDVPQRTWTIERESSPGVWQQVGGVRAVPSGVTVAAPNPGDPVFDTRGMLATSVTISVSNSTASRSVTINVLGQATTS